MQTIKDIAESPQPVDKQSALTISQSAMTLPYPAVYTRPDMVNTISRAFCKTISRVVNKAGYGKYHISGVLQTIFRVVYTAGYGKYHVSDVEQTHFQIDASMVNVFEIS